ncbi:hypothetical protein B296_00031868 [Ensete ventricosum]|uniref:Uncharacterized protein n=1 Tax=Ensete ventricosum TaxID=4639 RepID=A0A426XCP7_ENSVE|nr:hypothetical protein B296_00031868 [Ensete ventricosum]
MRRVPDLTSKDQLEVLRLANSPPDNRWLATWQSRRVRSTNEQCPWQQAVGDIGRQTQHADQRTVPLTVGGWQRVRHYQLNELDIVLYTSIARALKNTLGGGRMIWSTLSTNFHPTHDHHILSEVKGESGGYSPLVYPRG